MVKGVGKCQWPRLRWRGPGWKTFVPVGALPTVETVQKVDALRTVLCSACHVLLTELQPNHLCNPIPWLCQPGSQLKPLELKLKPSEAGWGWPKPCLRPYPVRCGRCHQCSSLAAWMCACDPKPSVTSWIARSHGRLENALVEGFTCSKFYRLRLHLHDFDTWLALDDCFSTRKLSWVTAAV